MKKGQESVGTKVVEKSVKVPVDELDTKLIELINDGWRITQSIPDEDSKVYTLIVSKRVPLKMEL